jgi:phosphoribosylformimino-5-aminoimidazole carboxamide ribotide isomerase
MRFRPCIDIHHGTVKQIVGRTLRDHDTGSLQTNYASEHSPAWFAEKYRRDGLAGGHVIMLGPGNVSAAMAALRAFPGGLQAGGGITPANARSFLDAGASHVIITSFLFVEGALSLQRLDECATKIGKDRLVVDLSCTRRQGRYYVATRRWQHITGTLVDRDLLHRLAPFCSEFLIHAIDYEGGTRGIDLELVRLLGEHAPLPVTYAGGIRSITHLDRIHAQGRGRVDVTIGSALDLFGGPLPYDAVVQWQHSLQQSHE